jgi:hypothetical protein
MNQLSSHPLQKRIWAVSLIAAPLLLIIAQFFWNENGRVTVDAGWLQVLAFFCWIPAFHAMFSLVQEKAPRYAIIGFVIACYACIGGNNFGIDGMYTDALGIQTAEAAQGLYDQIGGKIAPVLFIPGILFPLSLITLGVVLWRTRSVSSLAALLLIIGGLCFPLSRIPRIDLLAHIDNVILLVAHVMIALEVLKSTSHAEPSIFPTLQHETRHHQTAQGRAQNP